MFLYLVHSFLVVVLATTVSSLVDQNCNSVGRSSCLVHVQWMKAQLHQSRTVNLCLLKRIIALLRSYVCVGCMCEGYTRMGGGW